MKIKKIVIDTNVMVSGLLTPYGASSEIVLMVAGGILQVCYDARILTEYREVLLRSKFGFKREDVDDLLAEIKAGRPEEIIDTVYKSVVGHANGAVQSDDITMLMLRYNG